MDIGGLYLVWSGSAKSWYSDNVSGSRAKCRDGMLAIEEWSGAKRCWAYYYIGACAAISNVTGKSLQMIRITLEADDD